jgi:hypothetical protein
MMARRKLIIADAVVSAVKADRGATRAEAVRLIPRRRKNVTTGGACGDNPDRKIFPNERLLR